MFKILFITLSNIGDVALSLPALDALKANFPQAEITLICGSRPAEMFLNSPEIKKLIIFDKRASLKERVKLVCLLRKEKFDMVVDLRNSFFNWFVPAKYKAPLFLAIPKEILHMRERHLFILSQAIKKFGKLRRPIERKFLMPSRQDEEYINRAILQAGCAKGSKLIAIAPGARSHIKRWPRDKFIALISALRQQQAGEIILVGDKDDTLICGYIAGKLNPPPLDLSGKTTLAQLACLLRVANCVITNDSAILHLASYLNTPVAAIFGPTNELKYRPWPERESAVVKKDIYCRPCEKAQCGFGTMACLQIIQPDDVLRKIKELLSLVPCTLYPEPRYKRILIVRTDRIGDVLLSTPVIENLRRAYPDAYIAVMVLPYAKEIVEGNPYLDGVILYDRDGKHKSWRRSIKFARNLRKKKFDLALILHPTNRAHLVTFLAGIPYRIGYGRKLGFLLTFRLKHTKQLGQKHELEYNFDLLRHLGIEPQTRRLFMPLKPEAEIWAEELFRSQGIKQGDKVLAIHPGASCPSKIWPAERFAAAADSLTEKYAFKVFVAAGPKDTRLAEAVLVRMRQPAINLAGKTSVSQLASMLKRCSLFISNDSGPMHIASALGTPVISIFGRNQKGLSPQRWGPLGEKDKVLHKEVGCVECLAHNCKKDFACLKAISVEDVLSAAEEILKS
ncbi:MAG: lipopolysaccharide heptosyltransferase II [Candidatus Omnitrophota bacterium]